MKMEVNGSNTHPVYNYLRSHSSLHSEKEGTKEVPWSWSKFLVNGKGQVVEYYSPKVYPVEIKDDIKKLISMGKM